MANFIKPTIVLVHGAWHTPPNYARFISALQSRGFTVHCPHLPSCSNTRPPTSTYSDDVLVVRNLVQDLTVKGERIIMLMHSYGGAVGTDAVQKHAEFSSATNKSSGGVIHLLYLVRSPLSALQASTVGDAWRRLPVTYVMTTKDYSVPRVYQDLMLKKVAEEGVRFRLVDVDTAHSVFISREKEMLELVESVVQDERKP
ncbi:Alpha/Beta hydrolase protein [Aspergillus egyptiacus]|nr:Alpha/Beta hydrolase protein [Aspergillus egyptiacus]